MFDRIRRLGSSPATAEASKHGCLLGVRDLVANSVYDAHANYVGKLEEIVIEPTTGCVRHAVLAVGGVFGLGRRRLALPWSTLTPDPTYRRCVVDVTQMPFTAVRIPENDPWLQRADLTHTTEDTLFVSRLLGRRG
jgi:hypothetical protein